MPLDKKTQKKLDNLCIISSRKIEEGKAKLREEDKKRGVSCVA